MCTNNRIIIIQTVSRLSRFVAAVALLLFVWQGAMGQQRLKFAVAEFAADPFDLSARDKQYEKFDGSGDRYAIIKVKSTNPLDNLSEYDFNFGNMKHIVEEHDGVLWLYVQRNAKLVTITRKGYASVVKYNLNTTIESGKNYEMLLSPELRHELTQMVQFKVTPAKSNAVIVYKKVGNESNDMLFGAVDNNGSVAKGLPFGAYSYMVCADGYQTVTGRIILRDKDKTQVDSLVLKPAMNKTHSVQQLVEFNISPHDTHTVVIVREQNAGSNYELFGFADAGGKVAKSLGYGTYEFEVLAQDYNTSIGSFVLADKLGTQVENIELTSDAVEVTLKSDPEVEIFISGERKGIGQWTGLLKEGDYFVECRRMNHHSTFQYVTVENRQNQTIELEKPTPILGMVAITSKPLGAEITIDGVAYGQTPRNLDLIIGKHDIAVSKENYKTERQGFEVRKDKTTNLNLTLSRMTKTLINCLPAYASLYIDDDYKGNTPYEFEGEAGMHNIRLFCSGYKTIDKEGDFYKLNTCISAK